MHALPVRDNLCKTCAIQCKILRLKRAMKGSANNTPQKIINGVILTHYY